MRGKRTASPLRWRLERCTASKASSNTNSGATARTGPNRSVVWRRIQRSSSWISASLRPEYALAKLTSRRCWPGAAVPSPGAVPSRGDEAKGAASASGESAEAQSPKV